MFSTLNRALSWTITSFGNKFCPKQRSRLIKALNNRFYVKFMQLEIGLLSLFGYLNVLLRALLCDRVSQNCIDACEFTANLRIKVSCTVRGF